MNSVETQASRDFEVLGELVKKATGETIRRAWELTKAELAEGRQGPMVVSPDSVQPPYSFAFNADTIDFRFGERSGRLPAEAALALAGISEQAQAAGAQGAV